MTLEVRGINYQLKADTQSGVVGINAATEALKRADSQATRTGAAFLNFGKQGELTARQWWPVPAGGARTVQINPLGAPDPAAQLEAVWAPAYW